MDKEKLELTAQKHDASSTSSFKRLPDQLDWAFLALIGYCSYLFVLYEGMVSLLAAISALIILNGWISSRATANLYSDLLLSIDVLTMCVYFSLALNLHFARDHVLASYWVYSAALCIAYLSWDCAIITLVGKKVWRERFRIYVILMAISAGVFLGLYYCQSVSLVSESAAAIIGSLFWLGMLGKWHYDKFYVNHKVQG